MSTGGRESTLETQVWPLLDNTALLWTPPCPKEKKSSDVLVANVEGRREFQAMPFAVSECWGLWRIPSNATCHQWTAFSVSCWRRVIVSRSAPDRQRSLRYGCRTAAITDSSVPSLILRKLSHLCRNPSKTAWKGGCSACYFACAFPSCLNLIVKGVGTSSP